MGLPSLPKFDDLVKKASSLVKNQLNQLFNLIVGDILLEFKRMGPMYLPPKIEVTIEDINLDIKNTFVSLDVRRLAEGVYEFDMELIDMSFTLELLLLKYRPKIKITYGNHIGETTYTGSILNSKCTVELSKGVSISCTGILSTGNYHQNEPREYPAKDFHGSSLAILTDLCKKLNMNLSFRDDVEDKIIIDEENKPRNVVSDTSQTDLDFIKSIVSQLGPDIGFSVIPPTRLEDKNMDTLLVYKKNNSHTEASTNRNKIIADLNHRDSNISSYDFEVIQTQFATYGGSEKYVSVDPSTNKMQEVDTSSKDFSVKENMSELMEGAGKVKKWLTIPSSKEKDMKDRVQRRSYNKLNATYNVTLELMSGVPTATPFITELEINSWISSPTNRTGMQMHHTSGKYTIKEVTDHISNGTYTQTIVAFRAGGIE